jgi:DNA-binding response OmpR family regulator
VLVVDDDPKFASVVVRSLDRAGYTCLTASCGDDALRMIGEHRPDAVVLDVMIPPPTGYEVCEQLRADGWTRGIVMVSARHSPVDRAAALRAGADEFLGKPFPLAQLVAVVAALTRR